jgi:hypothetical protein
MKKAILVLAVLGTLGVTGCSSNLPKPSITALPESKVEIKKHNDVALDEAPEWYYRTPSKENVLYAAATARSRDMEMANEKALTQAQGKIAETVAGKVSKVTKTYKADVGDRHVENSSSAVKKLTDKVDFTGTEVVETKIIKEKDGWYRAYVLVALPLGEANTLLRQRVNDEIVKQTLTTQESAFSELDRNDSDAKRSNAADVTITPLRQ